MLTTNSSEVQQSILKARDAIEAKLKSMITGFASDVADAATKATPLGDSQQYANFYASRLTNGSGWKDQEGLARANWQYTESGSAVFVGEYGRNTAEYAVDSVKNETRGSYKIGQTFYIANSLEYIGMLENNHSIQTNGQGIMEPAIDLLRAVYASNLKQYYDAG